MTRVQIRNSMQHWNIENQQTGNRFWGLDAQEEYFELLKYIYACYFGQLV